MDEEVGIKNERVDDISPTGADGEDVNYGGW